MTLLAYTSMCAFGYEHFKGLLTNTGMLALPSLLEMMLDSESGILFSDINTLFNNIASNPLGNPIATNFLIHRWDDIEAS